MPTIGFSASHFTAQDLTDARHTSDLKPRPEVILNLDHAQRGLGTASCGPDTSSAVPAERGHAPVQLRRSRLAALLISSAVGNASSAPRRSVDREATRTASRPRRRARSPPREPGREAAAERVAGAGRVDGVDARRRDVSRLIAVDDERSRLAHRDDDGKAVRERAGAGRDVLDRATVRRRRSARRARDVRDQHVDVPQ